MKEKKVTIIILTWNGLLYTKKCINSLYENMTYKNCEIVIVDNGSTDETLEYLEQLDHITLIKNNKNLGFVQGNNIAINQIYEGDIILLNNDIIITQKKWIEELQKTAYSKEDYGIVGCRLINEKKDFLHAGTYIYPETYWGQQIGGGQKEVGQYSGDREVEGVVFACAYIKRSVLDAIG